MWTCPELQHRIIFEENLKKKKIALKMLCKYYVVIQPYTDRCTDLLQHLKTLAHSDKKLTLMMGNYAQLEYKIK